MGQLTIRLAVEEDGRPDRQGMDELVRHLDGFPQLAVGTEHAPAAPGAKGDPVTIGALVLVFTQAVLPKLLELIAGLRATNDAKRYVIVAGDVRLEVPVGTSPEQIQPLIDEVGRLAGGAEP